LNQVNAHIDIYQREIYQALDIAGLIPNVVSLKTDIMVGTSRALAQGPTQEDLRQLIR
jgi:hypothetical protein